MVRLAEAVRDTADLARLINDIFPRTGFSVCQEKKTKGRRFRHKIIYRDDDRTIETFTVRVFQSL